jgi:putative flavoprotein involved in K+ transport
VKAVSQTNHYMSGRDGGQEIDLRRFALEGVRLHGAITGAEGTRMRFEPNLEASLDKADRSYLGIRDQIDKWIAARGIDAPETPPFEKVWRPETETTEIDLAAEGITSILWAIGFRPDYSWLREVDCFDAAGRPSFRRGVTGAPGVYFIGLGWLNTWGSGRFLAIDEDARFLAGRIHDRHRAGVAA